MTDPLPPIAATDEDKQLMTRTLNLLLADEFVVYAATRECHWNLTDAEFARRSMLFEQQYRQLEDWTRQLAVRSCQIGGWSNGGWSELIKDSRLPPLRHDLPAGEMLAGLHALHEAMAKQLQTDATTGAVTRRYAGLGKFLTELRQTHEKFAWQLRVLEQPLRERPGPETADFPRTGELQATNGHPAPAKSDWTQL